MCSPLLMNHVCITNFISLSRQNSLPNPPGYIDDDAARNRGVAPRLRHPTNVRRTHPLVLLRFETPVSNARIFHRVRTVHHFITHPRVDNTGDNSGHADCVPAAFRHRRLQPPLPTIPVLEHDSGLINAKACRLTPPLNTEPSWPVSCTQFRPSHHQVAYVSKTANPHLTCSPSTSPPTTHLVYHNKLTTTLS
jgi:hypothetical protein